MAEKKIRAEKFRIKLEFYFFVKKISKDCNRLLCLPVGLNRDFLFGNLIGFHFNLAVLINSFYQRQLDLDGILRKP